MAILGYHSILNCHSPTKLHILASSSSAPSNNPSSSLSPPQSHQNDDKLPMIKRNQNVKLQHGNCLKPKKEVKQQPSILEIERAIGAGIFRERDSNREEEGSNLFGNMLRNSVGKSEGSVEKELRKTGEWLIDQTEKTSSSAGKQILMTLFLWILPLWIVALLVAVGAVRLPFDLPFVKDLVS